MNKIMVERNQLIDWNNVFVYQNITTPNMFLVNDEQERSKKNVDEKKTLRQPINGEWSASFAVFQSENSLNFNILWKMTQLSRSERTKEKRKGETWKSSEESSKSVAVPSASTARDRDR